MTDEPFLVVRTSASDHRDGSRIGAHSHGWHQLVHVRSGLTTVRTPAGTWIAPPTWAVWLPAGAEHELRFTGASALRTAYVRPDRAPGGDCRAFAVSPLLRELLARTTELGMLDERDPTEAAVTSLILAELDGAGQAAITLPEPAGGPTAEAARLIGEDPAGSTTAALARAVGLGVRTLERRFLDDTGLTVGRWRRQLMLLRGLEVVAAGGTAVAAARAAGYATPSAWVAAFRSTFGTTPSRWFTP
ncbi:helix-turn-helix transcriptional regulator [Pseudonocardia ailaonensis]|uniref:Helix-turn-helix transcriptional regulator n=1 Tax=Pseudonocardia ailaonensis TaxID=367279 RepID=A0ABN2NIR2_9PSEU